MWESPKTIKKRRRREIPFGKKDMVMTRDNITYFLYLLFFFFLRPHLCLIMASEFRKASLICILRKYLLFYFFRIIKRYKLQTHNVCSKETIISLYNYKKVVLNLFSLNPLAMKTLSDFIRAYWQNMMAFVSLFITVYFFFV